MHTSLTIADNNHKYTYFVTYKSTPDSEQFTLLSTEELTGKYKMKENRIAYISNENKFIRNQNEWIIPTGLTGTIETHKVAEIDLYFPEFSINTYIPTAKYALTISTWINGVQVYLGSSIINRIDCIADDKPFKYAGMNYYERFTIRIPDPIELSRNLINNCSCIYLALYPVEEINGIYYIIDGCSGGQSGINFGSPEDYMTLKLDFDETIPAFKCSVNKDNLEDYLRINYHIPLTEQSRAKYELFIGNEDSEPLKFPEESRFEQINNNHIFDREVIEKEYENRKEEYPFTKNGWRPGYKVVSHLKIYLDFINDEDPIIYLISNRLPFTEDIYKYFIASNTTLQKIDLSDMNINNINIVNKIVNETVSNNSLLPQTTTTIIQPVYFKSYTLEDIRLYPEILNTIAIRLKGNTLGEDGFSLYIEGNYYPEIGRTAEGIIFRVPGHGIDSEVKKGFAHIFDKNNENVASGVFKYME